MGTKAILRCMTINSLLTFCTNRALDGCRADVPGRQPTQLRVTRPMFDETISVTAPFPSHLTEPASYMPGQLLKTAPFFQLFGCFAAA